MYNIPEKMQEDIRLRGLSENTEKEYLKCTREFLIWAGKSVDKLDEENIRNYLKYLPLSPRQRFRSMKLYKIRRSMYLFKAHCLN